MIAQMETSSVIRVPDLVGQPLEKARAMALRAGVTIEKVLFQQSYEDRNTVVEQSPSRGKMVDAGQPVTIWVARRGYIENLPAIFRRSDALGRNVVRDICFLFEHMFGSIEDILGDGHSYYDPHECPPEFLSWLASWMAFTVDADWPEEKKRALIKRALDLYRLRGTRRGLILFLKLFTGYEPQIEEHAWPFRGFRVGDKARVGVDSVVSSPVVLANCFIVTLPIRFDDITQDTVIRVHEIIQREKPAHTQYYLHFAKDDSDAPLREFFLIGVDSGIGVVDNQSPPSSTSTSTVGESNEVAQKNVAKTGEPSTDKTKFSVGDKKEKLAPVKKQSANSKAVAKTKRSSSKNDTRSDDPKGKTRSKTKSTTKSTKKKKVVTKRRPVSEKGKKDSDT